MRNKIIAMLKNAGGYVSGQDMSRTLGISRAAVWKHIKRLKDDGYVIVSVTRSGYRLVHSPESIMPSAINSLLDTEFIARDIKYSESADSTNEEAKRCNSAPDGTLFIAEQQLAGKGRLGRGWSSPRGSGIWMSLLLKPENISPQNISCITLLAGMAVCRAIGGGAMIKWPNDIVISSRKVCGILTELAAEVERVEYVVCGIGINVNTPSFPDELAKKATSMFLETGQHHNRNELIAAVMNEFEPLYKNFLDSGFAAMRSEYRRLCANIDRMVRVINGNTELTGIASDVDENGGLVVTTPDGSFTVTSGEVSVRGIYDEYI